MIKRLFSRNCDRTPPWAHRLIKEFQIMSTEFDNLKAAVNNATTVEQGAVTLINGLAKQIADLVAAAGSGDTVPKADLQALADQLNTGSQALAADITANTPAAPPPPTSDGGTTTGSTG